MGITLVHVVQGVLFAVGIVRLAGSSISGNSPSAKRHINIPQLLLVAKTGQPVHHIQHYG